MTLKKVRNQQIDFESAAGPALLIQSPAKSVRPEFKGRALPQKMYYSGANLSSDLSRPLWSLPDVSEQESDPSRSLTVRGDLAEKGSPGQITGIGQADLATGCSWKIGRQSSAIGVENEVCGNRRGNVRARVGGRRPCRRNTIWVYGATGRVRWLWPVIREQRTPES